MAASTTQDDLIILDESDTSGEFDDNVIQFGDDLVVWDTVVIDENNDFVLDVKKEDNEPVSTSADLNFDLSAFGSDDKKNDESIKNSNQTDDSLKLNNSSDNIWVNLDVSELNTGFDLDSETKKFVERLNDRKKVISGLIKKDEGEINWLEENIKNLKDNVTGIKAKIKWLNEEDKKIDWKIALLSAKA